MKHTTLSLTTLAAFLATAATAIAAPAPVPVGEADLRPVSSAVRILDADGGVLRSHDCAWTVPAEDDRPCLRFASDPQVAVDAIREAGGARATVRVVSEPIGLDGLTTWSERADGTWLVRTTGTDVHGRPMHHGRVCTADGEDCARWDAKGARAAKSKVRAAAAKLR